MARSSTSEPGTFIISFECTHLLFMKPGTDLWAFLCAGRRTAAGTEPMLVDGDRAVCRNG